MSAPNYEAEMHIKIYDNRSGESVVVRPDSDGIGLLELDGGDEFGRIVLQLGMAEQVARAIIRVASDMSTAKPTTGE